MAVQAIVYSTATGRVRRVVDPQVNVPNVIAFLQGIPIGPGEARLLYNKVGNGADNVFAWQAAVNVVTLLAPENDRFCAIDANNQIVGFFLGDLACGDGPNLFPNCTFVPHPSADPTWTFTPPNTFTVPPPVK